MFATLNLKTTKPMKNLKIVLFSVLALGLTVTSCSDDDSSSSAKLEGKWIYSKTGASANGQEMLIDYDHAEGCTKDYLEIIEGGSFKDVEYDGSECAEYTDEGTWAKNGNTLTVNYEDYVWTTKIEKLTGSQLKISSSETEGGVTVKYVTVFTRE